MVMGYWELISQNNSDLIYSTTTAHWLWNKKKKWIHESVALPRCFQVMAGNKTNLLFNKRNLQRRYKPANGGSKEAGDGEWFNLDKRFFSLFQVEQFHTDDIKVFSPSQRIRDVGDLLWGSVAKLQAATTSLWRIVQGLNSCPETCVFRRGVFLKAQKCGPNVSKPPETNCGSSSELFRLEFKPERRGRRSDWLRWRGNSTSVATWTSSDAGGAAGPKVSGISAKRKHAVYSQRRQRFLGWERSKMSFQGDVKQTNHPHRPNHHHHHHH